MQPCLLNELDLSILAFISSAGVVRVPQSVIDPTIADRAPALEEAGLLRRVRSHKAAPWAFYVVSGIGLSALANGSQ